MFGRAGRKGVRFQESFHGEEFLSARVDVEEGWGEHMGIENPLGRMSP